MILFISKQSFMKVTFLLLLILVSFASFSPLSQFEENATPLIRSKNQVPLGYIEIEFGYFNSAHAFSKNDSFEIIYFTDPLNDQIWSLESDSETPLVIAGSGQTGFRDGYVHQALFNSPRDIVTSLDGTCLYVTEQYNHIIRKIDLISMQVSLYAGQPGKYSFRNGALKDARFAFPQGITIDNEGDLYIADRETYYVRKIDTKKGIVSSIVGTGIAGAGELEGFGLSIQIGYVFGIHFDRKRNILYFTDFWDNRVRSYNASSGWVKTLFWGKQNTHSPYGITMSPLEPDFIYIADNNNHLIKRFNVTDFEVNGARNSLETWVGDGFTGFFDGTRLDAEMSFPRHIEFDRSGNLLIADAGNNAMRKLTRTTGYLSTIIVREGSVVADGFGWKARFTDFTDTEISKDGSKIFVVDGSSNMIRVVDLTGHLVTVTTLVGRPYGGITDGDFDKALFAFPGSIIRLIGAKEELSDGSLREIESEIFLVGQSGSDCIRIIDMSGNGNVSTLGCSQPLSYLTLMRQDLSSSSENVFFVYNILDRILSRITIVFSTLGHRITTIAKVDATKKYDCNDGPLQDISLSFVDSIAVNSFDGTLYVSDNACCSIRKVNFTSSWISTMIGSQFDCRVINGFTSGSNKLGIISSESLTLLSTENPWDPDIIFSEADNTIRRIKASGNVLEVSSLITNTPNTPNQKDRDGPIGKASFQSIYNLLLHEDHLKLWKSVNSSQPLYFTSGARLRKIQNGMVETLAGVGAPMYHAASGNVDWIGEFVNPGTICVSETSDVYIIDEGAILLIRISDDKQKSVTVKPFAGDGGMGWIEGKALAVKFNRPGAMIIVKDSLIVADTLNNIIRSVRIQDAQVTTIAGDGKNDIGVPTSCTKSSLSCSFSAPSGLALDPLNGDIYIADTGNHVIKKFVCKEDQNCSVYMVAGTGNPGYQDGQAARSLFSYPRGLAIDPIDKYLFIADSYNHLIRVINLTASYEITTRSPISSLSVETLFGQPAIYGNNDSLLSLPVHLQFDSRSNCIFVMDVNNKKIREISKRNSSKSWSQSNVNIGTIFGGIGGGIDTTSIATHLRHPGGFAIDPRTGDIIINDKLQRVLKRLARIPVTSKPNSPSSDNFLVGILIVIFLASGIACVFTLYFFNVIQFKSTTKTLKYLTRDKKTEELKMDYTQERSVTLSPTTNNKPLAIPGYLEESSLDKIVTKTFDITGEGGTASVFRSTLKNPKLIEKHSILNVVVKVLKHDTKSTPERPGNEAEDRFLYEVMIMSSLPKNPHLIEIICFTRKPCLAIVMKDYPLNLKELITNKSFGNSRDTNLQIAKDIADGMESLHQSGVIHFDLKPANILIDFQSQGGLTCIICDFGFANFVSDVKDKIVKGVKSPSIFGITARFAAPELFKKAKYAYISFTLDDETDKKVDVYAYAMTIYNVFTRTAPWSQFNLAEQIERAVIRGDRPTFPDPRDDPIYDLIEKCWSQDPKQRPSFHDIKGELS